MFASRLFILLFSTNFLIGCDSNVIKKTKYYGNGNVGEVSYYLKSDTTLLTGKSVNYDPDGHLMTVTHYSKGKINGERISYYKDGTVKMENVYKDGEFDGEYSYYYPSGKLFYRI